MTDKPSNPLKNVSEGIRRDLSLETSSDPKTTSLLDESYVALPKQYDLKTEFLSEKAKKTHKELYVKYTQALTNVSSQLDTTDRKDQFARYHDLKRQETYNLNAVYLHELFFANVSDLSSLISVDSIPHMRLSRDFGTFDLWQFDFIACSMGPGPGWAVCAYNTFLRRFVNFFVEGHSASVPVGCYPVIVLDVWEHSYFRDYLTDRRTYVVAMMKELDWEVIGERFKRADLIGAALR